MTPINRYRIPRCLPIEKILPAKAGSRTEALSEEVQPFAPA